MTEDEAKRKICPIAKMRGSFDGNWDKGECIGSVCMLWRDLTDTANVQEIVDDFSTGGLMHRVGTVARQVKVGGYCGLGGTP